MGVPASGPPRMGQRGAEEDAEDFATREYPYTEPLIVKALHVDGITAQAMAGSVQFVGWQMIEPLSESPGERRVVLRFAMSEMEARTFRYALSMAMREGH